MLKVSAMKMHRVKQRFVEKGLDIALNGRERERKYEGKADGDFEAHLIALGCSEPPEGQAQSSLRYVINMGKVTRFELYDTVLTAAGELDFQKAAPTDVVRQAQGGCNSAPSLRSAILSL